VVHLFWFVKVCVCVCVCVLCVWEIEMLVFTLVSVLQCLSLPQ